MKVFITTKCAKHTELKREPMDCTPEEAKVEARRRFDAGEVPEGCTINVLVQWTGQGVINE